MQSIYLFFVASLLGLGWALPASNDNGPRYPAEKPFDSNVWPSSISSQVQDLINHHFQHIDDTSGGDAAANDKNCDIFAHLFTSDAKYNFQGQIAQGTAAIKQACLGLYSTIPYRLHDFYHAYSFGSNTYEIALSGNVKYGQHNIKEKSREWTEILELIQVDGGIKIQSERVFVDPESA